MSPNPHCVVVIAGGDPIPPEVTSLIPSASMVVAADSGIDHAHALGLRVDVAIGDFDSVSEAGLRLVEASGARVLRHPSAKDRTDLDLALEEALASQPSEIVVVGGHGGRLDHLLANALLLATPSLAGCRLTAHWGPARVHVLHGPDEIGLVGTPGEIVTLLPVHGSATHVRTSGLRYPLDDEELPAATTRGVSNVLEANPATIALGGGSLLVILPGVIESVTRGGAGS